MPTTIATKNEQNTAFQLKGSLFTLTVLHLFSGDTNEFQQQLMQTIIQAPKFFENAPVVIDLNEFPMATETLDLLSIAELLRAQKLIPVGIRGGSSEAKAQATKAGLAILSNSTASQMAPTEEGTKNCNQADLNVPPENISTETQQATPEAPATSSRLITQPVRSGQQIYVKGGDLIILAAVSHGAEVLADGHVHIYGPLRGRAMAGVLGNREARIFCQSLEAELISVAGHYLVNEQLDKYRDQTNLQIFLDNDQLCIRAV